MASVVSLPWHTLPIEMKCSVAAHLDCSDIRTFAKVNKEAYAIAVPAMWRVRTSSAARLLIIDLHVFLPQIVNLSSFEAVQSYIGHVPPSYHRYIRQLTITTKSRDLAAFTPSAARTTGAVSVSDALIQLLSQCTQVEDLTLNLDGSLTKAVIPCFQGLHSLTSLAINHVGDEQQSPL